MSCDFHSLFNLPQLTCNVGELNSDEWLQIARCAPEGEILSEETLLTVQALERNFLAEIVDVSGIFALA